MTRVSSSSEESYAKWAFDHESKFLILVFMLFIVLAGLVFYSSRERLAEINNLDSSSSIDIEIFTLEPYNGGQIWELDEVVRVYGTFKIIAPWYIESVQIPGQLSRGFYNQTVTINSAYLRTGSTVLEFRWGNESTSISIIISHMELAVFKLMNILWVAVLCMVVLVTYIPVGNQIVVNPSWSHLMRRLYREEKLAIEYTVTNWNSAIERSSRLISHLAGRTDYYRGLRGSMMSVIGILYTACLGLLTFILTSNIDPTISGPIILYIILTMVVLGHPTRLLVKSTTDKFLPITSWFFRGRISPKPASLESFEFDIDKNLYQIALESEKGVFMDNLREIVSLYHILRNAKYNYSNARNFVGHSVFNFIAGFGISVFVLFDIMDFVLIGLIVALIISIVIFIVQNFLSWMRIPTEIEIFTIFYDPDVLSDRDWHKLYSLLECVDQDYLRLIPTSNFDTELRKKLYRDFYLKAKMGMKEKGLTLFQFSRNPDSFGSKYVVMIVRKIGKQDELFVYPHYKEENGSKVLLESFGYDRVG